MASLVLGVAGAGIGSMFGYASIGWSIGSFIGGQLFGPDGQDIKGPRLSDKSVSTSAYGNMRPVIYGGYRVAGEIIWSTDLIEHAHKEEAGKGGGGGGSYTTYTYTVSFAMALCKGQIIGIRKMWFYGKLVYNTADDATDAELHKSEKLAKKIKVYTGSTTQTADPTMEAEEGAGNVPGYRGTAYIVFEDLDVTKYGAIPQITVEVIVDGSLYVTGNAISTGSASLRQSINILDGVAKIFFYGYTYDGTNTSLGKFQQRTINLSDGTVKRKRNSYYVSGGTDTASYRYLYPISVSPTNIFAIAMVADTGGSGNNRRYRLLSNAGGVLTDIDALHTDEDLDNYENGTDKSYNLIWEDDYNVWFYKANSGDVYHYTITVSVIGTVVVTYEKFNVDATRVGVDDFGGIASFCIDRASGDLFFEIITYPSETRSIKRYTRDGTLVEEKFSGISWRSYGARMISFSNGILYEGFSNTLRVYDWDGETLLGSTTFNSTVGAEVGAVMEASGSLVAIISEGTLYTFSLRLSNTGTTLDAVVEDICTNAGIAQADLDVTDLAADTVNGFMISSQTPARGALEQLSAAYFFDVRESDGVLEFVKRGDYPTVTLDDDDLGCYEGDDVQELAETTRTQEEELPKALTINYANKGADYQVGAQHSLRQSVLNGTEATIQLPMVFTDTEAKKIVDTMMYAAWQNRHQFDLKTWQSFQKLEPADVISARGETLRIVNRAEGVNGIIELTAVRELPSIYTGQVGSAAPSGYTSQSVAIGGPTEFRMLDTPPLRDADYANYGMYWAAAGYADDWPGAALMRSPDDVATWGYEYSQDTAAVIGQAGTALGNFTGGNVFDETNVLRVEVNTTLESKTETQVLAGANLALVGDELIQFRTATLVSTGVYDLTGLLRGRIGTEWAMDSHADNEDFTVLTSTTTRFIDVPTGDLNTVKDWGAITFGDTLEDIVTDKITYTGQNLRPLSPVEIGGGNAGYNSAWTINWKRRSRYKWQWEDLLDVGADEDSYDFEVAILNGATTVRTITVTGAQTTTYTHAQQDADFGYWQPTITVKIRQVGGFLNSEWSDPVTLDSGYISTSVLLMHGDGTNGSTTLTDEYGHTTTAVNNCAISTAQSKFGGASIGFDGTGDYFTIDDDTDFDFTSAFTFELQVYITAFDTSGCFIASQQSGATVGGFQFYITNTGVIRWDRNNTTNEMQSPAAAVSTGSWNHIAISWDGSTYRMFVNGNQVSTASSTTAPTNVSGVLRFGNYVANTDYDLNGYIDEIRITQGQASYLSNFTPPSQAFSE